MSSNKNKLKIAQSVKIEGGFISLPNGIEVPLHFMPRVPELDVNATIEMRAASYGPETPWFETGTDLSGFPIYQCISPVSHSVYTVFYTPRRGHFQCNCVAGKRILRLPSHCVEPTCWHLYDFNEKYLPEIMAARRAVSEPAPAAPFTRRTGELGSHRCDMAKVGASYPAPVSSEVYAKEWD